MEDFEYLYSEDREIFRDLFSHDEPLDIYFFHEKYLLSPGQVARVIRKYSDKNILKISNHKVELTELGRKWLIKNRRLVFGDAKNKIWSEIPDEFKISNKASNNSYTPKRKDLYKLLKNLD